MFRGSTLLVPDINQCKQHFGRIMTLCKLKEPQNLNLKNRPEVREHACVAETSIPNWADAPRMCWYQAKISINDILGVFRHFLSSKEPQILIFKNRPEVREHAWVAEGPVLNWANVPRRCRQESKIGENNILTYFI